MKIKSFLIFYLLLIICSCNKNKTSNPYVGEWEGVYTDTHSGRNMNETVLRMYKVSIYEDGTFIITESSSGKYNYLFKFEGQWKYESGSFANQKYEWISCDGIDRTNNQGKSLFMTSDGKVYFPYGSKGLERIRMKDSDFQLKKQNIAIGAKHDSSLSENNAFNNNQEGNDIENNNTSLINELKGIWYSYKEKTFLHIIDDSTATYYTNQPYIINQEKNIDYYHYNCKINITPSEKYNGVYDILIQGYSDVFDGMEEVDNLFEVFDYDRSIKLISQNNGDIVYDELEDFTINDLKNINDKQWIKKRIHESIMANLNDTSPNTNQDYANQTTSSQKTQSSQNRLFKYRTDVVNYLNREFINPNTGVIISGKGPYAYVGDVMVGSIEIVRFTENQAVIKFGQFPFVIDLNNNALINDAGGVYYPR
jgi:hypothetical protein